MRFHCRVDRVSAAAGPAGLTILVVTIVGSTISAQSPETQAPRCAGMVAIIDDNLASLVLPRECGRSVNEHAKASAEVIQRTRRRRLAQ